MNTRSLPRHNRHSSAGGFTLLELLVVIAILAMTATVAFRTTTNLAEQARLEKTQQTLEQIRQSIVGRPGEQQLDGTPIVSGFVADTGRLPLPVLATIGGVSYMTLNELTQQGPYAPVYALRQAVSPNIAAGANEDATVYVPCGWRGPYIRVGSGLPSIYDGWGALVANPYPLLAYTPKLFTFLNGEAQNTNSPTGYMPILSITNPIAGIVVEGPIYRENPITSTLETDKAQFVIDANEFTALMQIRYYVLSTNTSTPNNPAVIPNGPGTITAKVYGPNPNYSAGSAPAILAYTASQVYINGLAQPLTLTFTNLPHGPKVLRMSYSRSTFTNATSAAIFNLRPGINSFQNIYLRGS